MKYFSNFDLIKYNFTMHTDKTPIIETIVNFLQRAKLSITDDTLTKITEKYILGNNIKPEQLASSLYNDPYLHWTILYINGISDISSQWPLAELALSAFVTRKYGAGNEFNPHHYELGGTGIWVDPPIYDINGTLIANFALTTYGVNPLLFTNSDYESQINDLKRNIVVIKPEYVSAFVDSYNIALKSQSVLGD